MWRFRARPRRIFATRRRSIRSRLLRATAVGLLVIALLLGLIGACQEPPWHYLRQASAQQPSSL
jgi:hypothetical protein